MIGVVKIFCNFEGGYNKNFNYQLINGYTQ